MLALQYNNKQYKYGKVINPIALFLSPSGYTMYRNCIFVPDIYYPAQILSKKPRIGDVAYVALYLYLYCVTRLVTKCSFFLHSADEHVLFCTSFIRPHDICVVLVVFVFVNSIVPPMTETNPSVINNLIRCWQFSSIAVCVRENR